MTAAAYQPTDNLKSAHQTGAVALGHGAAVVPHQPANGTTRRTGYVDIDYTQVLDLGPRCQLAKQAQILGPRDSQMRDSVAAAIKDPAENTDNLPTKDPPPGSLGSILMSVVRMKCL